MSGENKDLWHSPRRAETLARARPRFPTGEVVLSHPCIAFFSVLPGARSQRAANDVQDSVHPGVRGVISLSHSGVRPLVGPRKQTRTWVNVTRGRTGSGGARLGCYFSSRLRLGPTEVRVRLRSTAVRVFSQRVALGEHLAVRFKCQGLPTRREADVGHLPSPNFNKHEV